MLKRSCLATALALLVPFSAAFAQHADDNPVVSADDAFGLTVGQNDVLRQRRSGYRKSNHEQPHH